MMRFFVRNGHLECPWLFNRERVILLAMQDEETICQMLDTHREGLGHSRMRERRQIYGANRIDLKRHKIRTAQLLVPIHEYRLMAERLAKQPAAVFRHGLDVYLEERCEELVPGDIIFLSRGDIVPADVRLLAVSGLKTDPYLLTGEHRIGEKQSDLGDYTCTMSSITALPDICFAGEEVTEGSARGVVIATGMATFLANLIFGQ